MALYELKLGNGGHGLEPFNTKTGKYEKLSFSFEGNDIDSWQTLRDLMFDEGQKEMYDNADQSIKDEIDNVAKEAYEGLLKDEVDVLNRTRVFDTPQECVDNIGDLLTPDMINEILPNIKKSTWGDYYCEQLEADPNSSYYVETIPALFQNSRYRKTKMNKISETDFNNTISNIDVFDRYSYNDDMDIYLNYVSNYDKVIVYRGLSVDNSDARRVHQGFVEDGPNLTKSLIGSGMYDSVIYMTMDENYASDYDDGLVVKGLANTKGKKIKIGYDEYGSNGEVEQLRNRDVQFKNNIVSSCVKMGYSQSDADKIGEVFRRQLNNDFGFCLMLLGYDAAILDGHQFDILNPDIVDLVY